MTPEPMNSMDIVVLLSAFIFFAIVYRYVSTALKVCFILAIGLVLTVSVIDMASRTLAKYTPESDDDLSTIMFFQEFMGEGQTDYQRGKGGQ